MMKRLYERMNEHIGPSKGLEDLVMEQAVPAGRVIFRPAAVIAAMLVVVMITIPAMAAAVPWILELVAPQLVEKLEPVQRSDTNNGITLEVVGASACANKAELVVKIEGELLKDPVSVAPMIEADRENLKSVEISSLMDYEGAETDKANGIYYYQVLLTYQKGLSLEELLDGEMTVTLDKIRISGFSSGDVEVPIILSDPEDVEWINVSDLEKYGYPYLGWSDSEEYPHGCELGMRVIRPTDETVYDVTDKLGMTAAAYIDGKLHIQMRAVDSNGLKADWGYWGPYLIDQEGNQAECLYRNSFSKDGVHRIDCEELIYDIPIEELASYKMMVRLKYQDEITADCTVTFRLTEDEVTVE